MLLSSIRIQVLYTVLLWGLLSGWTLNGQSEPRLLTPSDTLNTARVWAIAGGGATVYTASTIGLYQIWYRDYPRSKFHFFDDRGEWENMDKAGHLLTAYSESVIAFQSLRWAGVSPKPAAWIGAGIGTLLQGTIETLDGFSAGWGFSWADITYNTAGVGLFLSQELMWQEQRIRMKVSHTRPDYGTTPIKSQTGSTRPFDETVAFLYGRFPASFFKDYNGMTVWASVNPASFFRKKPISFPGWLNIAAGYGANNVFGAYGNAITDPGGNVFYLTQHPRYRQFYLSLDVDFQRIPTKNRALRTLFTALNWIKLPAPTLEWNTLGKPNAYWMYW